MYDKATFSLAYPEAFESLPVANLRKLFQLMRFSPDAIRATYGALREHELERRKAWEMASADYADGYIAVKFYAGPPKQAIANNNKLLATLKRSKHKHEKSKKLLAYFKSIYEPNEIMEE